MQNVISVSNSGATREDFSWLVDHRISRTEIYVQNSKVHTLYITGKPCGWSGRKNDTPTKTKMYSSSAKLWT